MGTKSEKAAAVTAAAATLGAVGAIATLASVTTHGVGLYAIIALGVNNGFLGCIATKVAVGAYRHTRPARPGALRRHSFYLTGVVKKRAQARKVVKWLAEQEFLGEDRQRRILRDATAKDLTRRGLRDKFPELTAIDAEKIADTLMMVRAIEVTTSVQPRRPLRET